MLYCNKKIKNMRDTKRILEILSQLAGTSSSKEKSNILSSNKDFGDLRELCARTCTDVKYYVSSEQAGISGDCGASEGSYTDLLDRLAARELTGDAALTAVRDFYYSNAEGCLLKIAIDHDLRAGVSKGLVKKVWPELFSTFSVALAEKYDEKTEKVVDFDSGEWLSSRKLDGVRCICVKENGKVTFYARSGKEFKTLDVLKRAIEGLAVDNFVLDGECCIIDPATGADDFIGIVSEIKRKNWTISNPKYLVFDCLTLEEFRSCSSTPVLTERLSREPISALKDIDCASVLEQLPIMSREDFDSRVEEAASNGWEGIIIRKNASYEGKRSKNMLKVKKFQDAEYVIESATTGTMRFIENGKTVEKLALSSVEIRHRGNIVSVGSGFSKEERIQYGENPELLVGKTVTVKYFQESINDKGLWSLRFPTVKYIYTSDRDC